MSERKDITDLEQIFAAGDAWLTKYGVVSPIMHNNIILNLYMHFPKVKYVEYFLYPNATRKIHVVMHYRFIDLLFRNKEKIIDEVIELLKEYLYDYEITVELKRFKGGNRNEKVSNITDNSSVSD